MEVATWGLEGVIKDRVLLVDSSIYVYGGQSQNLSLSPDPTLFVNHSTKALNLKVFNKEIKNRCSCDFNDLTFHELSLSSRTMFRGSSYNKCCCGLFGVIVATKKIYEITARHCRLEAPLHFKLFEKSNCYIYKPIA